MREILFKGKAVDGYKNIAEGEWIEGSLFYADDEYGTVCYIATSYLSSDKDEPMIVVAYQVDSETVCQYTGLTNKNGRKIFEGDIVRIDGQQELFTVVWVCDTARFGLQSKTQLLYFEFGLGSKIEVIGNIYENSDLLKE